MLKQVKKNGTVIFSWLKLKSDAVKDSKYIQPFAKFFGEEIYFLSDTYMGDTVLTINGLYCIV